MGNDNILMVVVLAIVAYFILTRNAVGAVAEQPLKYCAKGKKYLASTWDLLIGCDSGYIRQPFSDFCECQDTTLAPVSIPTPAEVVSSIPVSEWSGTPKVAICPYDSTLLAGDRRCQMPTPGAQSLTTGISPFTGQSWLPDSWSW